MSRRGRRCFAFNKYIASVGTSVRERMYDASMANTTASARGTKRYRATPLKKNIGRNTMQMQSVDTRAGTAICAAPSRMASRWACPSSKYRSMFSIVTVASSTRIPTARAKPPSVMMLMVSPRKLRIMTDVRMDSGMETAMIKVLRQLPRKSRIINPVRHAAMTASRSTPLMEPRTKMD